MELKEIPGPPTYTLHLSELEIEVLHSVLRCVEGNPGTAIDIVRGLRSLFVARNITYRDIVSPCTTLQVMGGPLK